MKININAGQAAQAPIQNGGSGGNSSSPTINVQPNDLTGLQSVLTQNANAIGQKIATAVSELKMPGSQKGGGVTPPTPINNTINLDIDTESLANDETMQNILEVLKGKFVNED